MSRPSVFFDNVDELRNEYDWMYEFMSRMAEQIRGNPDVHSLAGYVAKIEDENARLREEVEQWHRLTAGIELPEYPITEFEPKDLERENAKLRELAQEMYCVISENNSWWDFRCDETKAFHQQLQELGIKVGE